MEKTIYLERFEGKYKFLSNLWPCRIYLDGIEFHTVEHAYQAAKVADQQLKKRIASCRSAGEARQVASKMPLRPDWKEVKLQIMEELIRKKFLLNRTLGADLMSTYPADIVIGSMTGDTFWGVHEGVGLNLLGKILMKVREELIEEKRPPGEGNNNN
ncbi:MAG: NADAR family protein [Firmicutes bacterium]|nr:NADAR family protein [Bacillota bacterium]